MALLNLHKFYIIQYKQLSMLIFQNFSNPSSAANKKTCLEVLIKEGANVRVTDRYQATPLHHACSKGHHGAVELLLQQNGIAVEVEPRLR